MSSVVYFIKLQCIGIFWSLLQHIIFVYVINIITIYIIFYVFCTKSLFLLFLYTLKIRSVLSLLNYVFLNDVCVCVFVWYIYLSVSERYIIDVCMIHTYTCIYVFVCKYVHITLKRDRCTCQLKKFHHSHFYRFIPLGFQTGQCFGYLVKGFNRLS